MLPALLTLGLSSGPAVADADTSPQSSDIVAIRSIAASPEAVVAVLSDLHRVETLWPADCTRDWLHGAVSAGPGASAELTYTMGPMRRRLAATLSRVEAGRFVELDHAGKRGFITRWVLTPGELGTSVEAHTWIQPPPWPFGKLYTNRVQPVWQGCQEGFLEALSQAVAD